MRTLLPPTPHPTPYCSRRSWQHVVNVVSGTWSWGRYYPPHPTPPNTAQEDHDNIYMKSTIMSKFSQNAQATRHGVSNYWIDGRIGEMSVTAQLFGFKTVLSHANEAVVPILIKSIYIIPFYPMMSRRMRLPFSPSVCIIFYPMMSRYIPNTMAYWCLVGNGRMIHKNYS